MAFYVSRIRMNTKMDRRPIGFFDSGLGGLSVWEEVNKLLPHESTIYLADSRNAPYGVRSKEEIVELSLKNTEKLIDFDCKLIVVACNTATTSAIEVLRDRFDIPFVGIEPAIKSAAFLSQSRRVGVLATKGTLVSDLFLKTKDAYAKNIQTITQEGTGLVELIEHGKLNDKQTKDLIEHYVQPMIEEGIDYLVLGCTHYPFLKPYLKNILPSAVEVLDSGEAIAKRVHQLLNLSEILTSLSDKKKSSHKFYTNKSALIMQEFMDLVSIKGDAHFDLF